jgi:CheY-like chemotaxis protein
MPRTVDGLAGRRILVVEDQYLLAMDLKRTLERSGATVVGPVGSAERALALIPEALPLDAAILDINLEAGGTAYPVAEVLRARKVPFVFATGYDRGSIRPEFRETPNIGKPFDLHYFAKVMFR